MVFNSHAPMLLVLCSEYCDRCQSSLLLLHSSYVSSCFTYRCSYLLYCKPNKFWLTQLQKVCAVLTSKFNAVVFKSSDRDMPTKLGRTVYGNTNSQFLQSSVLATHTIIKIVTSHYVHFLPFLRSQGLMEMIFETASLHSSKISLDLP